MTMLNLPARSRHGGRLTRDALALVLAGGRGSRLGALTDWRAKPAVPFGGRCRIIDFALSNCHNSDIRRVLVLTQYKSHSLVKHLMAGWNFLNSESNGFLDIIPAQQWLDDGSWYLGTADAVYQSLDIVTGYGPKYVVVLAGDHVYAMDYAEMLGVHVDTSADVTIACTTATLEEAREFGVMEVDGNGRIVGFEEKPKNPKPMPGRPDRALVSMGIYVFLTDYLAHQLRQDAIDKSSSRDFGRNIIPALLSQGYRVQAYYFGKPDGGDPAYWRDVGTTDGYFNANMELLAPKPELDLFSSRWPILSYQAQVSAARMQGRASTISDSIIGAGAIVEQSRVSNSILSGNVKVHRDCVLDRVVALPGCEVRPGARLRNVILDGRCVVPAGTVIGENPAEDAEAYGVTAGGIVTLTRQLLGQGPSYHPSLVNGG